MKLEDIRENGELLIVQDELDNLVNAVKATSGNIAEVGMFQGGSAQVMCEVKGDRNFYGFDTFEGIPYVLNGWRLGRFKADKEQVEKRLSKYTNVTITKGIFPNGSEIIKDKKFGLVNLDVDTNEGTEDGLKFFAPRMEKGGMIIIHDYPCISGVRITVDKFCESNGLTKVQSASNQCTIKF
jgi:O-methyltransferase